MANTKELHDNLVAHLISCDECKRHAMLVNNFTDASVTNNFDFGKVCPTGRDLWDTYLTEVYK